VLYNDGMSLSGINFEMLGIPPAKISVVETLRQKGGHTVCRLKVGRTWHVLKWFEEDNALEPQVYDLLERYGIPTLPVHARTGQSLLLEDLSHSRDWRLANLNDMTRVETGLALAAWYRSLHAAGYEALVRKEVLPVGLVPWMEQMTIENIGQAGRRLGIGHLPGWQVVLEQLETLKARARREPHTFNYEDFAHENLALSRCRSSLLQAVVFDYDCFTLGMAYSDIRNVMYSLEGKARQAFTEAYGPSSETERLLDIPLAAIYGLLVAAGRESVPGWARPLLDDVKCGRLESAIQDALA